MTNKNFKKSFPTISSDPFNYHNSMFPAVLVVVFVTVLVGVSMTLPIAMIFIGKLLFYMSEKSELQ